MVATEPQQRVAPAAEQGAVEIRNRDDAELQPLGVVDGHHPHAVVVLGLGGSGRLVVLGAAELEEVEKAPQVATLAALELTGEPHQLADVRHPQLAGCDD